jgi:2'-5' RNA ligase
MMTFKQYVLSEKIIPGVFIGIELSEKSLNDIMAFIDKEKIPNPITKDEIHITLIYSKKEFSIDEWKNSGITIKEIAKPLKFDYFGDNNNCLVMLLESQYLLDRNNEITKTYGAISDYSKYTPHITLSYDCTNCQPNFSQFPSTLELVTEYATALDDDWTSHKGN